MSSARKYASNTRGRPFQPGNPGKPKGARHRTTLAIDALLDGDAANLTRKAIEMALGGDTVAMRLCLDRPGAAPSGPACAFRLAETGHGAGRQSRFGCDPPGSRGR